MDTKDKAKAIIHNLLREYENAERNRLSVVEECKDALFDDGLRDHLWPVLPVWIRREIVDQARLVSPSGDNVIVIGSGDLDRARERWASLRRWLAENGELEP